MRTVWRLDVDKRLLKKQAELEKVITLDDLAKAIGVTRQALYLWRAGTKMIPAEQAAKLAAYLGCEVWDIWHLVEIEDEQAPGKYVVAEAV